jgi:hypothetical protein
MKRFSYFVMAAMLTAGLSTVPAMAQAKKAQSAPAAKTDPCQSEKDAVKSAKKADKKTAQAALKKCQDANKPAAKKKGGK